VAVGEAQNRPFQLSFNSSLKVDFQGARVTSDGGLLLVRELERLSQDPVFRLIGSRKIWERGAALTSRLQRVGQVPFDELAEAQPFIQRPQCRGLGRTAAARRSKPKY
jgi:hypothetical protein